MDTKSTRNLLNEEQDERCSDGGSVSRGRAGDLG